MSYITEELRKDWAKWDSVMKETLEAVENEDYEKAEDKAIELLKIDTSIASKVQDAEKTYERAR